MNVKNVDKTIKLFSNNKYTLTIKEKDDLKYRLKTKSYYLYEQAIKFLKNHNIRINYRNISNLIKLEIRIRNNVRTLITAFEEAIWNKYILKLEENGTKTINLREISKNIKLAKAIKFLKLPELDKIRNIRNDVSHLVYFIISKKMKKLISDFKIIKEINFVAKESIEMLFMKVKKDKAKLGFSTLEFR